jgi:ATP-dependent DNA helicase PIF1
MDVILDAFLKNKTSLIFLSGSAGTGKSYIIRELSKKLSTTVVAFTGQAALQANGRTIHSFFKFKFNLDAKVYMSKDYVNKMKHIKVLIIDEISMVPAKLLDKIDETLQCCLKSAEPFGGIKTLIVGDLYQLPPVNKNDEDFYNVYHAKSWNAFKFIELTRNYRQMGDELFLRRLNDIRIGNIENLGYFDQFVRESYDNQITNIFFRKRERDLHNDKMFSKISKNAEITRLRATITSIRTVDPNEIVYHMVDLMEIIPNYIDVCIGTKVMCLMNIEAGALVNGTMGTITDVNLATIAMQDTRIPKVKKFGREWNNSHYDYFIVEGFPIAYAWGITSHKAQGTTLHQAMIHNESAFVAGQMYVTISRLVNSDGLYLKHKIAERDIIIDQNIPSVLTECRTRLY